MDSTVVIMDALEQLGPRMETMTYVFGGIVTAISMWVSKIKKVQFSVAAILMFLIAVGIEKLFLGQMTAAGSWDIGYQLLVGAGITGWVTGGTKAEDTLTKTDWRGRTR